jgi:hypothetical protein
MTEDEARELAFAIIGEFEGLLDEKDITIPSADREGRPEEACIYGSEYYLLEYAITDILAKARDLAFGILEEFEGMLDCHGIKVPSADPQRATSQVALCMPEWDKLRDGIVRLLCRETAAARSG